MYMIKNRAGQRREPPHPRGRTLPFPQFTRILVSAYSTRVLAKIRHSPLQWIRFVPGNRWSATKPVKIALANANHLTDLVGVHATNPKLETCRQKPHMTPPNTLSHLEVRWVCGAPTPPPPWLGILGAGVNLGAGGIAHITCSQNATNITWEQVILGEAVAARPCHVEGLGLRVEGSGFRVQGSGFRVQGSGFRVEG